MVALDILVVTTALTTIRQALGASVESLEWTVTAYNLTFAVLLMTASALGDRYGRRRLFAAGIALFTLGSAICAASPDARVLVVGRSVQGVGAAVVSPLAFALVGAAFPAERRGRALGLVAGVTGLATLAGPVIGGVISATIGWNWIFWINVPIGLISVPLVLSRIEESYGAARRLDVPGLVLVTGACLGLVWGLVRAAGAGVGGGEVAAALVAGAVAAVAFVVRERRAPEPMLPMRFFRIRAFAAGNVVTMLHSAVIMGTVFWMAQFLQSGLGYGPLGAGLRMLPWTGTMPVVAPLAGALADRFGNRVVMVGGLTLQGAGLAWLAVVAAPGLAYPVMVPALVIAGIGGSAVFPAVQSAVVGAVGPAAVGQAAGANSMLREVGGMIGIAVLSAVFAVVGGFASARVFSDGFGAAIGVASGLAFAGALASIVVPRPRAVPAPTADPAVVATPAS
jgi:EmrB/QacA subfamily drug resistance transporter